MNKDGVVSTFDPTSFEIFWKNIPGYTSYEVSNLGVIRIKKTGKIVSLREHATSKGTYLNAAARKDEDNRIVERGSHIFICLAFHGLPPTPKHEVNHKDGNKHNNFPDNLEWSTRKQNLIHAYQTGLRQENRRVIVTNHDTGKVETYYAMAELARDFNTTKGAIWALITNHTTEKYNGRFTFEIIAGSKSNKKADSKIIYAIDHRTDTLHVADNYGDMELSTGIKRNTIRWNLVHGQGALIRGFAFTYDPNSFSKPTEEEIMISMISKHAGNKGKPIEVTNTLTNTTKIYGSLPDFAKEVGIKHTNTISRAINDKDGKLGDYLVKYWVSSSSK